VNDLEVHRETRDGVQDAIEAFYDQHPYPPPVANLDDYRQRWQAEATCRADFHLHWPGKAYRTDLKVLVAGCGTSQAVKHAMRQPDSQVVGIDISETSVRYTEALKRKYNLANLKVYQLSVERANELGCRFDKIVCTGVLHHLPEPEVGLRSLRDLLEPDGAIQLMVYATYGRVGVYMLQDYCRRLGIEGSEKEIKELANTLTALSPVHPLARLLAESPDFSSTAGLADALLNPQDRAYTVPQLFDLIRQCEMRFVRWIRQAPYLPQCGSLAATPHASRLTKLSQRDQYAAVELFRGNMLRHSLVLYRIDQPVDSLLPRFNGDGWLAYVPIRLPETRVLRKNLPPGAAAVLINQAHTDPDILLPVNADEMHLIDAIDGKRGIDEIIQRTASSGAGSLWQLREHARSLFERLYWFDQIVFQTAARD
jgi:SAM-dependent methyltransferase